MIEELEKKGYDRLFEYCLFKIDSGKYIVLSVYSRKLNFGFFYIDGHRAFPDKEDRKNVTKKNGQDYRTCVETAEGKPEFVIIDEFPSNIFILNESCYWWQSTDNSTDEIYLITKNRILEILKQNISNYLKNAPKPME